MYPSRNLQPVRSYGIANVPLRGGFVPYGSTTASGQPTVPMVTYDVNSGPQPRWGGFVATHDPLVLGRYNVLLDADWIDLLPNIVARTNLNWQCPTVFMPSDVAGHGLTFMGLQPGPGMLAQIPISRIVYASPNGGSTTATYSNGVITITPLSPSDTNAGIAAVVNAASATLGVTCSAGDTDTVSVSNGAAVPGGFFSGGVGGAAKASAVINSNTAGSGVEYVAVTPGVAGQQIRIVYNVTGSSDPSVAVTSTSIITVTIGSTTHSTNTLIAAAVNASAAAAALVTAYVVGTGSDQNTVTQQAATTGVGLVGGVQYGMDEFQASVTVWSITPGSGITYTAVTPGAQGNDIQVQYIYSNLAIDPIVTVGAGAKAFIASDSAGSGVLYTGGAGLQIKYVFSSTADAAAALSAGVVTVTIPTSVGSTTNATIVASVNVLVATSGIDLLASAIGTTSDPNTTTTVALKGVYLVGGSGKRIKVTVGTTTHSTNNNICQAIAKNPAAALLVTAQMFGQTTAANAITSDRNTLWQNQNPAVSTIAGGGQSAPVIYSLTGGGRVFAQLSGATIHNANDKTITNGVQYYHMNIDAYQGDQPVDMNAQTEMFIPSATIGSGVLIRSGATSATAASVKVISSSSNGVVFTSLQPGDAGNTSGVVYAAPLATLFTPSTTNGDGITWTAVASGTGGRAVQLAIATPSAGVTDTVVIVNGTSIVIFPEVDDTNTDLVNAVAASVPAAALVSGSATGASDVVIAFAAQNLGGGYSQAASTATCSVLTNAQGGYTLVFQFGSGCTNAQIVTGFKANTQAVALFSAATSGTTSDPVVATAFTALAGGADPADLQVVYKVSGSSAPAAAISGSVLTVTISSTTPTNTLIAQAINSVVSGVNPQFIATPVGLLGDLNTNALSGSLACHNIVEFTIAARDNGHGAV